MTNAHCSECNTPIFRYDDQEFCPTCQKPVNRQNERASSGEDGGEATQQSPPADEESGTVQVASPEDGRVVFGNTGADAEEASDRATPSDSSETRENLPQQVSEQVPDIQDESSLERHTGVPPAQATQENTPQAEGHADIEAARNALIRALHRFSNAAVAADDPRRATEHLEAAHEAAKTLAVLDSR